MSVKKVVHYLSGIVALLFLFTCGSDKKGDAIGTIKATEYPETYEVRADGELLQCEPADVLPLAQRYSLF